MAESPYAVGPNGQLLFQMMKVEIDDWWKKMLENRWKVF
jgi:Ca-activated chloride channel family protein